MPALVDLRRNTVKGYLGAGTNCEAIKGLRRQTADGQAVQQILLVVQEELAAERLVAHSNAEDALAEALEGCHDAEGRLREAIAAQEARKRAQALLKGRERPNAIGSKPGALAGWDIDREPRAKAPGSPTIADDGRPKQTRRRGRPAKAGPQRDAGRVASGGSAGRMSRGTGLRS